MAYKIHIYLNNASNRLEKRKKNIFRPYQLSLFFEPVSLITNVKHKT